MGWSSTGERTWTAQEKGIDVLMALEMAMGARDNLYDIAVVVSGDSDLVPAIEVALAADKDVQTAMRWSPQDQNRKMRTSNLQIPHHRLDARRFNHVQDPTDYANRAGNGTPDRSNAHAAVPDGSSALYNG